MFNNCTCEINCCWNSNNVQHINSPATLPRIQTGTAPPGMRRDDKGEVAASVNNLVQRQLPPAPASAHSPVLIQNSSPQSISPQQASSSHYSTIFIEKFKSVPEVYNVESTLLRVPPEAPSASPISENQALVSQPSPLYDGFNNLPEVQNAVSALPQAPPAAPPATPVSENQDSFSGPVRISISDLILPPSVLEPIKGKITEWTIHPRR